MWNANSEFRDQLAARALAVTATGSALSDESVIAAWNSLNSYIEDAMILESARWGDERISDTGVRFSRDDHWAAARDRVTIDFVGRAAEFLNLLHTSERNGSPFLP